MTYTYNIKGITCEGCVTNVKAKLLKHPDVLSADVKLEGQKATLSMKKHLTALELQELIGVESKYRISADTSDHSHKSEGTKSWIATYKPLLIIAAFISVVSGVTAGGNISVGMNHFMAGFFLVFSFFKLLDLRGFASSYAMYDLLAMKVPAYGYLYPCLELGVGFAFLTGFNPLLTNWATVMIMGFSSFGVIRSVVNKQKIRCACLGAVFNLPMSTITIIEDLLMVGMAGTMLL